MQATLPAQRNSQAGSTGTQNSPGAQSESLWQIGSGLVQTAKLQHTHRPPIVMLHAPAWHSGGRGHATPGAPQRGSGGPQNWPMGSQLGDCAYAGVRMEEMTGADHAMAVPAPIRLSMRLREIR
jgi:hypothetical protein